MIPYKHENLKLSEQEKKESDRGVARQKNIWLYKILRNPDHPLKSFVDYKNSRWISTNIQSELCVQAGHLASRSSGAKEYLALEMAFINQSINWAGFERGGNAILRSAIRIGDIPVERNSAIAWKNRGLISWEDFERGYRAIGDSPY